jgi:Predicted acyl esterases
MIIMSDNIKLNATLERPKGIDRCPLCIIIHGFTGNSEEPHLIAVADTMLRNGIAALRVDMYGHGKSEGIFEMHNLYKWLNNGLDIIDYARNLDFVTDIYLCGHSQGGLTVMLLAAMEKERIKALIPLSPATVIPDGARTGNLLGIKFDPVNLPDHLLIWDDKKLNNNYIRVAQTIDLDKAIAAYKGKTFIAIGGADETVDYHDAELAASKYADCKFEIIPEDTHCFDRHLDQMASAVESFIRSIK